MTQESLEKILDSKLDSKLYAVVDSVNLSVDKKLTDFHSEIDKKIDDVKSQLAMDVSPKAVIKSHIACVDGLANHEKGIFKPNLLHQFKTVDGNMFNSVLKKAFTNFEYAQASAEFLISLTNSHLGENSLSSLIRDGFLLEQRTVIGTDQ